MPWSGFQSLLSVLTHMAPLLATLGWKIFVRKKPAHTDTHILLSQVGSYYFGEIHVHEHLHVHVPNCIYVYGEGAFVHMPNSCVHARVIIYL